MKVGCKLFDFHNFRKNNNHQIYTIRDVILPLVIYYNELLIFIIIKQMKWNTMMTNILWVPKVSCNSDADLAGNRAEGVGGPLSIIGAVDGRLHPFQETNLPDLGETDVGLPVVDIQLPPSALES